VTTLVQHINWVGFRTLVAREVTRFLSVYRQTVFPGVISSALYIIIFGFTLQQRISSINDVPYTIYIIPGLVMMNVITNAYNNTASSLLQMKLLGQLQDMLITPLSNLELAFSFIIGGAARGFINGVMVLLLGMAITGMPLEHPFYVLLFLLMVSWSFSSVGLIIGIMAESWDNIATMVNFFITPLIFLGGVFYSINMLPGFWRTLSMANPIYYVINGLRYSVLGGGAADSSIGISLFGGRNVSISSGLPNSPVMLRRSWAPLFLFTCFLGAHDLPDQPPEWTHYLLMGAAQEESSSGAIGLYRIKRIHGWGCIFQMRPSPPPVTSRVRSLHQRLKSTALPSCRFGTTVSVI